MYLPYDAWAFQVYGPIVLAFPRAVSEQPLSSSRLRCGNEVTICYTLSRLIIDLIHKHGMM